MAIIIDKMVKTEIIEKLQKLNIEYYVSCSLDFLYSPVNTHPDMQIHFISQNIAVAAPSAYDYYKNILPESIKLLKGSCDPGSTYPKDCAYNVTKMGKKIIGNLNYTDSKILDIYRSLGCEFINVKQGYTKCNLCVVDNNSAITEDDGLYRALKAKGMDVLKIPSGFVSLSGFDYGFIGGASGFVEDNKLAFFGKIADNFITEQISRFAKSKCVDIIYLSSTDITDFGSILYFNSNS